MHKFRLCPRPHLCCRHLLRRPCRSFFRRDSSRIGPAVAEPPLPASLRPPWITCSRDRILRHDQPSPRENLARRGAPCLLRLHPGPPSTQFLLCRVGTPQMRPHLLRPYVVPSLQRHIGVSAPQQLYPRALPEVPSPAEIEFIVYVERFSHTDWAREQLAEPVLWRRYMVYPSRKSLVPSRRFPPSPGASQTPHVVGSDIFRKNKGVSTQTTTASSSSCGN